MHSELDEVANVLSEQRVVNEERVQKLDQQSKEIELLQQALVEREQSVETLRMDQRETVNQLEQRDARGKELDEILGRLQSTVQTQIGTIDQGATRLQELERQVEGMDVLQSELHTATQSLEKTTVQCTALQNEHEAISATSESLQTQVNVLNSQLNKSKIEAEEAKGTLSAHAQKHAVVIQDFEQQTGRQQKSLGDLTTQIASKTNQYEKSLEEITGLTHTLKDQRSSITKLMKDLKEVESLRNENSAWSTKYDDLMARLRQVSAEHEDSLEANSQALDRIRELETDLHQQAAKIRDLRRERASIRDLDGGEETFRRAA